ncbi:Translocation and assembly module TamB [Enhygromyxa salina]|uniref:Translocation and assembly module TamB n=1 Tax=Enhygromyxa salina TaxID=215803 RepID=A0A2S9YY06_9BACT|nr:Translocation and assembly module TamB [Enhygromyxa salina]
MPTKQKPKPKRRWWRWLAGAVVGLITALVFAVLVVAWVPAASQRVARVALERWDAGVPGEVEWQGMRGSLGAGLELQGFELRDADGRALIRASSVLVDLDMASLVRIEAGLERVHVRELEVWVDRDWSALAAPSEGEAAPSEGLGPELPLRIRAGVELEGARIYLADQLLVSNEALTLGLTGIGRSARAELELRGTELPQQQLGIESLTLALAWAEPTVTLERLEIQTTLGRVRAVEPGEVDVDAWVADVALQVDGEIESLAERLGLEQLRALDPAVVRVRARVLEGAGDPAGRAELTMNAELGETTLELVATTSNPAADAQRVDVHLDAQLAAGQLHAEQGPVTLALALGLERDGAGELEATVELRAKDRHSGAALELDAGGSATSLSPLRGAAWLELRGPALAVEAAAASSDTRAIDASWSVIIEDLGGPLEVLAPYVDDARLASVGGSLTLTGSCASQPGEDLTSARCPISLALDHVAGFDTQLAHASLNGELSPLAEPIEFAARLELDGLRHPQFGLDQAELSVAGTSAQISVAGHGHGMQEQFEIDADLTLAGPDKLIDLRVLDLVSSRGATPAQFLLAHPARITIGPERITLRELRAHAVGGQLAVDGHVGLADQPSDLHVELRAIDLERVDAVIPGPRLRGRIDLDATIRGRLDQPSGSAWLRADALEVGDHAIGEVELATSLCGPAGRPPPIRLASASVEPCRSPGELVVWARVAGPLAKLVELDARVPVRVGEQIGLQPGRKLDARFVVRELELVELGGLLPATPSWWRQTQPGASAPPGDPRLIPEGQLDLELTLAGTSTRPQVELRASARELAIDRTPVGTVALAATLGAAGLHVDLDADLTLAQVTLDAEIPMKANLTRPSLRWDRAAEHVVALSLVELDLDALDRTLGPKLPALATALAKAELGGRVSASVHARGPATGPADTPATAPWLSARVDVDDLTHRDLPLGDASVGVELRADEATGTLALAGPLARRLDARVALPVLLTLDPDLTFELGADASIDAEVHVHAVELAGLEPHLGPLPLTGRADLDVQLRGSLADPKLEVAARLADLQLEAERVGDLTVYAHVNHERATVETDLVRRGAQLIAAEVQVPLIVDLTDLEQARLGWDRDGDHRLSARGRGLDAELVAALLGRAVSDFEFETALSFDVDGRGTISAFELAANLDGRAQADDGVPLAIHGALALDQRHQGLTLVVSPISSPSAGSTVDASLTLAAGLDADVAALLSGDQVIREVPFTLDVAAPRLALELFAPFSGPSLHDPRGTLSAELTGRGVLAAPELSGALAVQGASITVIPLRERLHDIDVEVDFDHQRVELRTLRIGAGRGQISGSGQASFDAASTRAEANLEVEIREVPIVRPGLPAMTLDSDVEIDVELAAAATRVSVALAHTEIKVAGVTRDAPKSIPSADQVVFVTGPEAQPTPDAAASAATVASVGPALELRLELRDPLQITGSAVDMAWAGSLGITRDTGLEIDGQLEARRGRLELLGHRFDIRRGLVNLPTDGSLDPFLDIIAETSTTEADVTVTIRGRTSAPELRFSSSPALSEYQILTLLVTGSTELGQGEGEVQAKAASLLAAVSNPKLQQQLDRYLGIDRANIGFGDSIDQPILSVGKRVTPKVFVETTYHHNAPDDENTAEVGVEYDFARRWSLETYFGDAAVGGVGVYWTHSFGAVPWRPRPVETP